MPENIQRAKLLKLWEIFYQYSDEEHPLSISQIIEHLEKHGISVDRRTLYEDIKLLDRSGYEIICVKSNCNYYYTEDRAFELSELKILLDAVQSANFISEKKTAQLMEKILKHAGINRAEILKQRFICFDVKKCENETVLYAVNTILNSIKDNNKISFRYFNLNLKKERIYRKEGDEYLQTPVQLICANDNYYLVTYSEKYNDFVNFRVDRMSDVKQTDQAAIKLKQIEEFNPHEYKKKMFSMYSGRPETVDLIVHNSLIDVILDRFGIDTQLTVYDDEHFRVLEKIDVSPTFFAWCFTFKEKLRIRAPEKIVAEAVNWVSDLSKCYGQAMI